MHRDTDVAGNRGPVGVVVVGPSLCPTRCRQALIQEGANMLVLSRQRDETIMIGDDILVTVVDIRGDKVRLGITAPKEVTVHRKEVYEAIRRENRAAAQVKPEDLSGLGNINTKGPNKDEQK
jgi:carbon storage regulator